MLWPGEIWMSRVLGWFELAASTIPIGDAITVLRGNGPKATVYGVHGATAVVLLGHRSAPIHLTT